LRVEDLGIGFRVDGLAFQVDESTLNVEVRVRVSRVEGLGIRFRVRVEGLGFKV